MKKILIVVDMQNDFISGTLGNEDCRNAVKGCVDLCENGGFDYIVFTRDTHGEDYLNTLEGKKLPVRHCIYGTEGWNIIQDLRKYAESETSLVIDKTTFGSLHALPETVYSCLTNLNISDGSNVYADFELHFCGVCTSICVLSNMAICRAQFPNARIVLHKGATGDVTDEMKQAAFVCANSIQCEVED